MTLAPYTTPCNRVTTAQHQSQTNPLLPSGCKAGMKRAIDPLCAQGTRYPRRNCSLQHSSRVGLCTRGRSGWVPPCRDACVGGRKDSQEAKHGQRGSSRIWAHAGRHMRDPHLHSPSLWFCSQLDPCQPPTPPLPSLQPHSPPPHLTLLSSPLDTTESFPRVLITANSS